MARSKRIAIVGAGVSGLTAAYELTKAGCAVSVFEQRQEIGGLARSVTLGAAPIERYYHFICAGDHDLKVLAQELGLAQRLHWRPAFTSYYVDGTLYPFTTPLDILRFRPVSLLSRLRFGLHSARARRFTDWQRLEHMTAQQWLVAGMGQEAYRTIWWPLLHMKFGSGLDTVSAPWIWHRIHRVATSRRSLFRPEELGYFEGGTHALLTALLERITAGGGEVRTACPVRALLWERGRVTGVVTEEAEVRADAVISTVPLPALVPLLPEAAATYQEALSSIPFLGVVCLLLWLENNLTSSFWVNVNDHRAPFNGFVEYTNLNVERRQLDGAMLYIPLYMPVEDPRFAMPDHELADHLMAGLATLFPSFARLQVRQWLITRDLYAQAVCTPGFSARMPTIASPLPGLLVTDSTQLYPADRNISGTISLARQAAALAL